MMVMLSIQLLHVTKHLRLMIFKCCCAWLASIYAKHAVIALNSCKLNLEQKLATMLTFTADLVLCNISEAFENCSALEFFVSVLYK